MDADTILLEAEEAMDNAVKHTITEFGKLHTGKASPSMVEGVHVKVESYGTSVALREIAAVTTPDPRTIQIQPWDKNTLKDIEKAILVANLGLNPAIQGNIIRVPVPELSGDRRKELVRVASSLAEEGRVSIRHARHVAMESLKKMKKDGELGEDDEIRFEKEVQSFTDDHVKKINDLLASKEEDLTKV